MAVGASAWGIETVVTEGLDAIDETVVDASVAVDTESTVALYSGTLKAMVAIAKSVEAASKSATEEIEIAGNWTGDTVLGLNDCSELGVGRTSGVEVRLMRSILD